MIAKKGLISGWILQKTELTTTELEAQNNTYQSSSTTYINRKEYTMSTGTYAHHNGSLICTIFLNNIHCHDSRYTDCTVIFTLFSENWLTKTTQTVKKKKKNVVTNFVFVLVWFECFYNRFCLPSLG